MGRDRLHRRLLRLTDDGRLVLVEELDERVRIAEDVVEAGESGLIPRRGVAVEAVVAEAHPGIGQVDRRRPVELRRLGRLRVPRAPVPAVLRAPAVAHHQGDHVRLPRRDGRVLKALLRGVAVHQLEDHRAVGDRTDRLLALQLARRAGLAALRHELLLVPRVLLAHPAEDVRRVVDDDRVMGAERAGDPGRHVGIATQGRQGRAGRPDLLVVVPIHHAVAPRPEEPPQDALVLGLGEGKLAGQRERTRADVRRRRRHRRLHLLGRPHRRDRPQNEERQDAGHDWNDQGPQSPPGAHRHISSN